ncbi:hypothetical protein, partial [Enterobacter sp. 56-7]|uniref:hypothetical protein n=1 Tax=Enterobacter sp. 56-7 TaxID=1895906 RepID=UPI00257DF60E
RRRPMDRRRRSDCSRASLPLRYSPHFREKNGTTRKMSSRHNRCFPFIGIAQAAFNATNYIFAGP